jgi:hypothetical protein
VYEAVEDKETLSIFMQHHIYSVWDFMSLVKYLQNYIAPATIPWLPSGNTQMKRFINDIVLEEESDEGIALGDGVQTYTSHVELYMQAMEEVKKGSTNHIKSFLEKVQTTTLSAAFKSTSIPVASQEFMNTTFGFLNTGKVHVVAAAFALGREQIIPKMFQALLDKMSITRKDAAVFHYYLDRHIQLDSQEHGPMALQLLELLCEGDPIKIQEAKEAALDAIRARIKFWDGVLLSMNDLKIQIA